MIETFEKKFHVTCNKMKLVAVFNLFFIFSLLRLQVSNQDTFFSVRKKKQFTRRFSAIFEAVFKYIVVYLFSRQSSTSTRTMPKAGTTQRRHWVSLSLLFSFISLSSFFISFYWCYVRVTS